MLDPRIAIMDMIHDVREQLNQIEMQLWDLPHNEPVAEYEEVFVAPVTGDYLHPSTPTHPCPEDLGTGAYWDECCQAWMVANDYDWDDNNLSTNYNTDMSFLPNSGNVWVAESADDWSNNYANDWYIAPTEILEEYVDLPTAFSPSQISQQDLEPIMDPAVALTSDAAPIDPPVIDTDDIAIAAVEAEAHLHNDQLNLGDEMNADTEAEKLASLVETDGSWSNFDPTSTDSFAQATPPHDGPETFLSDPDDGPNT